MILDEIVSIKKIGIRQTVDVEVDGDHLFFCNGILTQDWLRKLSVVRTEENIQGK